MKRLKEWIKEDKWFALVVIVIVGYFLWFQLRPTIAMNRCHKEADWLGSHDDTECKTTRAGRVSCVRKETSYSKRFKACLNKHGIK